MTALLDTNILIRHLTGDPPDQAKRATQILAGDEPLILTDVIAAECSYVLGSVYGLTAARIAETMRSAMALPSIDAPNREMLTRAFELLERFGISFADCYLIAAAEADGSGRVASFDRGVDRVGTVERIPA